MPTCISLPCQEQRPACHVWEAGVEGAQRQQVVGGGVVIPCGKRDAVTGTGVLVAGEANGQQVVGAAVTCVQQTRRHRHRRAQARIALSARVLGQCRS